MSIGRLLIVIAVVWFAVRLYRGYRLRRRPQAELPGKLVRCAACGVYLPAADAQRDTNNEPVCAHHGQRPG